MEDEDLSRRMGQEEDTLYSQTQQAAQVQADQPSTQVQSSQPCTTSSSSTAPLLVASSLCDDAETGGLNQSAGASNRGVMWGIELKEAELDRRIAKLKAKNQLVLQRRSINNSTDTTQPPTQMQSYQPRTTSSTTAPLLVAPMQPPQERRQAALEMLTALASAGMPAWQNGSAQASGDHRILDNASVVPILGPSSTGKVPIPPGKTRLSLSLMATTGTSNKQPVVLLIYVLNCSRDPDLIRAQVSRKLETYGGLGPVAPSVLSVSAFHRDMEVKIGCDNHEQAGRLLVELQSPSSHLTLTLDGENADTRYTVLCEFLSRSDELIYRIIVALLTILEKEDPMTTLHYGKTVPFTQVKRVYQATYRGERLQLTDVRQLGYFPVLGAIEEEAFVRLISHPVRRRIIR